MAMTGTRVLGGRYVLCEALGTGGMATVYRARDEVLGREVAVKVLSQQFAGDAAFLARFQAEARHVAALKHPRIVTVFDSGIDESTPFIVMELVPGRSLRQILDEAGAMPVEEAVAVATGICEALEAVHAAGLVHRDIKPANILLSGTEVKVLDFGIARAEAATGGTRTQAVLGTAAYLSPEQASGHQVGPKSDLYALGCVLFEMLAGAPPFSAESAVALAYRQVHHHAGLPSARRPGLPAQLDLITSRLLAKDPAARPASATAVRAALLGVVAPGHTEVLPPVPGSEGTGTGHLPTRRGRGPGRFRPRLTELILAAALAGTAGALAAVLLTGSAAPASSAPPHAGRSAAAGQTHQASQPKPSTPAPGQSGRPAARPPVSAAAGTFVADLKEGVLGGQVSQQAGQNLFNQLQQVLFSPPATAQQVDQQYAQLVQVYDQYLMQGQITGWAISVLRHDLGALGSALGVP